MFSFVCTGKPNDKLKCCRDCYHLQGAVTLWCMNDEAIEYRGTGIPGVKHCQFWKPMSQKRALGFFANLFTFGIGGPIEVKPAIGETK